MEHEATTVTFWNSPRKTRVRRWIFYVHFYAGLIAGLIFTVVGITGSAIEFVPELRRLEVPGGTHVLPTAQTLPIEILRQKVKEVRPHDTFVNINFEMGRDKALSFRTASPQGERIHTFVNQYTGAVLYQDNYNHRFLQKIYDLHSDLLGGTTGRTLNAWFAILLLVVSLAGILLWWRGRKYWRLGFEYRIRSSWKRQSWDLHSIGGFLFFLPLLALALTGIYYSYQNVYAGIAKAVTHGPAVVPLPRVTAHPAKWQLLDDIVGNASRAVPNCAIRLLTFPPHAGDSVSIRFLCPSEPHPSGLSYVYVDPVSARVLGVDRFAQAPLGVQFIRLITPIHFGDFGGLFTRLLWFVIGLIPGTLFVTSLLMWWNRSISKTWRSFGVRQALHR
jgi:uncharacterized iron-regulated membrane protein